MITKPAEIGCDRCRKPLDGLHYFVIKRLDDTHICESCQVALLHRILQHEPETLDTIYKFAHERDEHWLKNKISSGKTNRVNTLSQGEQKLSKLNKT